MKTIELSTALKPLAEYAGEFGDEIVVLTANHKPIATVISLKNVDWKSLAVSTNSHDEMKRAVLP